MTEYKLIRTNRKSLSFQINSDGLIVRAPIHMSVDEIEQFILKKQAWIEKHLGNVTPREIGSEFKLAYGDKILFRGKECLIAGVPEMNTGNANQYRGKYEDGMFLIGEKLTPQEIRFILSGIYIREAKKYIPDRVAYYAKQMQLSPESVNITSAFSRWGSCSNKTRLNFAWRLMMGDDAVIDSVVVHELSHMRQMNHSKNFYAVVYQYYPEYDSQQQKLKDLGLRIRKECWRS